ncbi:MAG: hypothetical protein ACOYMN_17495 [Roseimicrobium sp.]
MKTECAKELAVKMPKCIAIVLVAVTTVLMNSCVREDEELQRLLIETRAALATQTQALDNAQAQLSGSKNQKPTENFSVELTKAKARIAELTAEIAALKSSSPATLDIDTLAKKADAELMHKAKQLGEMVQKQSPSSRMEEMSVRAVQAAPQVVAPFASAITFNVFLDGRALKLVFPVTADLRGSWKLPSPDEVQKAFKEAEGQVTRNAEVAQAPAEPQTRPSAAQGDVPTFEITWPDENRAPQVRPQPSTPSPAHRSVPIASSPPIDNFAPPSQAAPAATSSPPPAAPQVPAPIMPVVGDRVIRF